MSDIYDVDFSGIDVWGSNCVAGVESPFNNPMTPPDELLDNLIIDPEKMRQLTQSERGMPIQNFLSNPSIEYDFSGVLTSDNKIQIWWKLKDFPRSLTSWNLIRTIDLNE
jgi:hypothetical protein